MPSNFTEHYSLSQWEKSDKVLMEDFNADNQKLDQALRLKGDCFMAAKGHFGNGKCGTDSQCTVYFDHQIRFMVIADRKDGRSLIYADGCDVIYNPYAPDSLIHFSSGYMRNSEGRLLYRVQWYSDTPEHQFNVKGQQYSVIGFYNMY